MNTRLKYHEEVQIEAKACTTIELELRRKMSLRGRSFVPKSLCYYDITQRPKLNYFNYPPLRLPDVAEIFLNKISKVANRSSC